MNTIEQAARRLEQLRQAGIDVSADVAGSAPISPAQPAQVAATVPPPVTPTAAPPVTDQDDLPALTPDVVASMIAEPDFVPPALPAGSDKRSRTVNLDLLKMSRAG